MEGKFAAQRTIAIILARCDWFHREPYVSERYRPRQSYLDDSIARRFTAERGKAVSKMPCGKFLGLRESDCDCHDSVTWAAASRSQGVAVFVKS